jgi:exoribonuclease-2
VKLLGSGEYALEVPGRPSEGHFGLAVKDYTHSTAPNRRFPDLVTQRLLKAALSGQASPYGSDELATLARHCTQQEDNAAKVERQVRKSAAALLLASRIGARFDAIVTGASDKGTWVRIAGTRGRRQGRAPIRRPGRRRPCPRRVAPHGRCARLHRLCSCAGSLTPAENRV